MRIHNRGTNYNDEFDDIRPLCARSWHSRRSLRCSMARPAKISISARQPRRRREEGGRHRGRDHQPRDLREVIPYGTMVQGPARARSMATRSSRSARSPKSSRRVILADMVVHGEVKLDTPVAAAAAFLGQGSAAQRQADHPARPRDAPFRIAPHASRLQAGRHGKSVRRLRHAPTLRLPLRLQAHARHRRAIRIFESGRGTAGSRAGPQGRNELQRTTAHPHSRPAGHDQHQHHSERRSEAPPGDRLRRRPASRPRTGISTAWPEPARFAPPPTICSNSSRPTWN